MDKRKLLIIYFVISLSSFFLGGFETSGSEVISRVIYGFQAMGLLLLALFSKKRLAVLLLTVGFLASLVGGWAKEIRYVSYFAAAFLVGLENGKKFPTLFSVIFVPYATLTFLVMLAQTLALSPVVYLWDNSAWHDNLDAPQIALDERYDLYGQLSLSNPLFDQKVGYLMTQRRPSGLTYANNLTCSLILLGMVGLFISNKNSFPKKAYLFAFPIILSGGLLSYLGTLFLSMGRFFFFPKQRRACLWLFAWLIGLTVLYQLCFPGLAEGRSSSEKIIISFTNRATNFLGGSDGNYQETVEICKEYLLRFSSTMLSITLILGCVIIVFSLKEIFRLFPKHLLFFQKIYPLLVYLSTLLAVPMHRNIGTYFFLGYLFSSQQEKTHKNFSTSLTP